MISANYITEWAAEHPWCASEQVEQDLLIARALVALTAASSCVVSLGT